MRRTISRLRPLWWAVVIGTVLIITALTEGVSVPLVEDLPPLSLSALILLSVALIYVSPRTPEHEPVVVAAPVRGRWAALNTPGQQLPSHGTRFLGQYSAVDIILPTTPETPAKVRRAWRSSRPEEYPSFGEPVYAMAEGVVVRVRSRAADHRARNTWQGLIYLMTVEGFVRSVGAPGALFGNHVLIQHEDNTVAVYAHLRQASVPVKVGQRVSAGEQLGQVGNTGNSSEPHLHVHLMDRVNPHAAAGLTMIWDGITRPGEIEPSLKEIAKDPEANAVLSMPRNGEIFEV